MTRLVPVRDVAHLRLALPADESWMAELSWVPASLTEIHLASRYYPLAIRYDGRTPRLGLLLGQDYLSYPLRSADGTWRGAYRPIALRCFPFQAPRLGGDPLTDIVIESDSKYLSATTGQPIVGPGGGTEALSDLLRLFQLLRKAEASLAPVLDHLVVADVLVPLVETEDSNTASVLHVIDPKRFETVKGLALGAMARTSFLAVETAAACVFSLQNLKPAYRRTIASLSTTESVAAGAIAPETIAMNALPLAIDDGELVALSALGLTSPEGVAV
jgi:hypothetical protein